MDPIEVVVNALALGAAAGLKDTASQVVKDAYSSIKTFIKRKYEQVSVDMLENDPSDKVRQAIIGTELKKFNAGQDEELLQKALIVVQTVESIAPQTAAEIAVSLEDVKAMANIKITDLIAHGTIARVRVDVKRAEASGDFEIKGLQAGDEELMPKKQGGQER